MMGRGPRIEVTPRLDITGRQRRYDGPAGLVCALMLACGPTLDADGQPTNLGRIRLRTFPTGARAVVDGKLEIVRTPATLVLPEGAHRVRIQAPGAPAIERTLYVTAGTSRDVTIRIPPPPAARIHVFADVVGADVRINGYRRGVTPLFGAITKPGPVDVTVSAAGEARSAQTTLAIGEQKTIEIFFGESPADVGPGVCKAPLRVSKPPPKGRLTLGMKPEGIVETTDGQSLGTTPLVRVPFDPGEHTLILRSTDGRYRRTVDLRIEAGETAVFRFRLGKRDEVQTATSSR